MSLSFQDQWRSKLEDVSPRVAPWERHKIPPIPQNPTDAEIVAFLEVAQPLMERGQWWYFLMGSIRSWKSVWSSGFGKVIVFFCFLIVHQFYAYLYLQSFSHRVQTVGGTSFIEDLSTLEFVFPWFGDWSGKTEAILERHQEAVALHYKAALIGWDLEIDYPYSESTLQRYQQEVDLSTQLEPKVLDLEQRASDMGWELDIMGFPYDPKDVKNAEQQIDEIHPKVLSLESRAQAIGWDLDIVGFPYKLEEVEQYEQEVSVSESLREKVKWIEREQNIAFPYPYTQEIVDFYHSILNSLSLKLIPAGSFDMGCTSEQKYCFFNAKPVHKVRLTRSFNMMRSEVTQGLWKAVMETNPSLFSTCGYSCPIEKVTWKDAVVFSNRLNDKLGLERCYSINGQNVVWEKGYDCEGWRLPTEAEWEYAARGRQNYRYAGSDNISDVGWYRNNSENKTHPVCEKKVNGYGLCDMSGNVFEWVWDWYGEYPSSKQVDPKGPERGEVRTRRGGGWGSGSKNVQISYRNNENLPLGNGLGFRLCRTEF